MRADPLPEGIVESLAAPDAYRADASRAAGIEHVQTHLSHVFLRGERVYKLRKQVDLGFVRFLARAERNADCLKEIRLNRRLSPDVYLGVAPVRPTARGFELGAVGEALADGALEHCVVMRRLPAGRDALSLLESGRLVGDQIDAVARCLARFHALHRLAPVTSGLAEQVARVTEPVEDCIRALQAASPELVDAAQLARTAESARHFVVKHAERLRARCARFVDGHGDLHLQHIWFERDDAPLIIDCLEFSDELRRIDAACDVAFLAMDLCYRGKSALAERFLSVYAGAAGDFELYPVVDYYVGYRALVRAKVAAIAARDPGIDPAQRAGAEQSTRRHLALAERAFEPRAIGPLILLCGVVGSGKSSAARVVADETAGVSIGSDPLRKRLLGIGEHEHAGAAPDSGVYRPELRAQVYQALLERAALVAGSGRLAILDASFDSRARRDEAGQWIRAHGARMLLIETRCERQETLARLARRLEQGRDASDAGPELYPTSVARFEPPDEIPSADRIVVRTDAQDWGEALRGALRSWLGRHANVPV